MLAWTSRACGARLGRWCVLAGLLPPVHTTYPKEYAYHINYQEAVPEGAAKSQGASSRLRCS
ncbi:hypothetical protein Krac_8392 [Ktedonobacter racemifer DSM 44963]|uniref:Uncharacterized protein n=1 Tax=Ktedonobacter racemifer DSM 44963 TaxID=485913 RepID=D6TMR8_KTERA|nr:hypothetical protein Krac_8392 [Ktedonobacter racemifer DSM 44963]